MKTITAGKFTNICLKALDEVARTQSPIIITKRGDPIAKLVPFTIAPKKASLAGSILRETGDPFGTGEMSLVDSAQKKN